MDAVEWDARYAAADLVWSAEPNRFLPPAVEGIAPGRALDLACGEGRNAIWLARAGWEVVGVDFSPVAIEKARRLAGDTPVDFRVADVTTFDAGTFDLVLLFYVHLPPAESAAMWSRAVASVAPGGRLFAVGHAVRNLTDGHGGPQYPEILWDADAISPALAQLDVVEFGERTRPVDGAERPAIDLVVSAVRSTVRSPR